MFAPRTSRGLPSRGLHLRFLNAYFLSNGPEANKNDKRNEPNLSRPSSAGETRKMLLKEVPIYAGHSDTELDADLTLDLSSLN